MLRKITERITELASDYLKELTDKEGMDQVVGYHDKDVSRKVDRLSEQFIIDNLNSTGFKFKIITEESGTHVNSEYEYVAVIDPLDGSTNYLSGIPWSSVSLAIFSKEGDSVAGSVKSVFTSDVFSYDEHIAYVNKTEFKGSAHEAKKVILAYFDYKTAEKAKELLSKFRGFKFRSLGCSSLDMIYTCLGRTYLFLDLRGTIRNVDVASSSNFCKRLGYEIYDLTGRDIDIDLNSVKEIDKGVIVSHKREKHELTALFSN
ncbi:extragenic suppressor protein suhB [Sulfolobales archaeon HS-7]|nr:extragenic suppressor protein suhB [Sulfolobales archaeon HS-7]